MTDREKLISLINESGACFYCFPMGDLGEKQAEKIADYLMVNGVMFVTDNNDGCKRIEELEAQLAEREKVVIQLRKQWQDAELHICTMCGHFDHKTDGNIVYGNQTCGEICGYPFCKEKFTPWIPVSERLPEHGVIALCSLIFNELRILQWDSVSKWWLGYGAGDDWRQKDVTHWMLLPEPPKEEMNNG